MNKKPFELGIMVGRFQTLHSGHEFMIDKAVELCDRVGIFIGSSQESGTEKNPFTYETRKELLEAVYGDSITICPLPDIGVGNNSLWGDYVLKNVSEYFGRYPDLVVSGKENRRNTWYDGHDITEIFIPKTIDISASEMREFFINNDFEEWKKYTNSKLWSRYDELRETVLASMDNTETDSI